MTRAQYRSSSYTRSARRAKKRRGAGYASREILFRTLLAALLAAALSLVFTALSRERRQPRIVLKYADEHSQALPSQAEPPAETQDAPGIAKEYSLPSSAVLLSLNGELREMELEEYIAGVVAAEMPASAEPEALKAQAAAARTFTVLHMEGRAVCAHGAQGCTVCSDPSCCQAFKTDAELRAFWGEDYEANLKKVREAVFATRGVVVLFGGRPISALYHASSGPATENSEAVFAAALPYLVSVDSREGGAGAVSAQEFTEAELIAAVNSAYPDAQLSSPLSARDIDVWGRTESGRVQLVQLGSTVLTGGQLRALLGLKSTDFTVEISEGRVRFTCIGCGHGVGMSQYGANEMAKQGCTYEEILLHFYTGTELARITFQN